MGFDHVVSAIWHGLHGWGADNWEATGVWAALGAALTVGWGQVKEAARLRREEARPNVAIFTDESAIHPYFVDLVIQNFGLTPALNITITGDLPLQRVSMRPESRKVLLPDKIPVLAPGQQWRTYWDEVSARVADDTLPKSYQLHLAYTNSTNDPLRTDAVLDWNIYRNRTVMPAKGVHQGVLAIEDAVEAISAQTTALSAGVDSYHRSVLRRAIKNRRAFSQLKREARRIQRAFPDEPELEEMANSDHSDTGHEDSV